MAYNLLYHDIILNLQEFYSEMAITNIKSGIAKETIPRAFSKEPGKGESEFLTLLTNQIYNKNISNSMFSNNGLAESSESSRAFQWVIIGMLTEKDPTILDLLSKHPQHGKNFQDILNLEQNGPVKSHPAPVGSAVFLNNKTREILYQSPRITMPGSDRDGMEDPQRDPLSENLAAAVKPYLGSPYDRLDCYELVVQTLEDMGLRYQGTGGLKEHLMNSAIRKGLPGNAYLTGEGLIAASGNRIYAKELSGIQDPEKEADTIISEIAPLLREGNILSFSTPSNGHMGIISRHADQWTFINSGQMDHNLKGRNQIKAVGEETLAAEIQNWVQRAATRNEPLEITLGKLDGMKLVEFSQAAWPV